MDAKIPKNPFDLLWIFCLPENKSLTIEGLDALELKQQLELLDKEQISTPKQRSALITKLKVDDLKQHAHKRIRLKSVLSAFNKQCYAVKDTHPEHWTQQQIAFSLFVYMVERLRRTPKADDEDDKKQYEKDVKNAGGMWSFAFYLNEYAKEKKWTGGDLLDYFNEITQNGLKTNGFALKLAKLICKEYDLKLGKYARVRKHLPGWYTEALAAGKKSPSRVIPQSAPPSDPHPVTHSISAPAADSSTSTPSAPPTATVSTKKKRLPKGTKWYWMDMDIFQWIPYRDQDQKLLDDAFEVKKGRVDVVSGRYRVEFDAEGSASGQQFENGVKDPINHMVVNGEPEDGMIHGMGVQMDPK